MITRSGNGAWSGEQFIGEGRNPAVDAKNGYLSIVYVRVLPEGFLPQRVGFLKTYQWSSSTSRYETFGDENGYWIRFESNDALINADTQPSVVLGFQNTVADLLIVFDGSAFNGGQYQSGVFYARAGVLFGGAYFLQSARVIPSTLVNDASRSLVRYPSAALLPSGLGFLEMKREQMNLPVSSIATVRTRRYCLAKLSIGNRKPAYPLC
jgi:hypothetical protein